MSRLIDAEQTKLMLSELLEVANKEGFTHEDVIDHACIWVDCLPTAYDVEKVVADIEEFYEEAEHYGFASALSDIVEVVKRGGVE